ncbi:hypothetical protein TNCV_147181 [Trichonephila clavipes]|nr:hypothetical protein TNCV_147181 [Trichonephila clavipes]
MASLGHQFLPHKGLGRVDEEMTSTGGRPLQSNIIFCQEELIKIPGVSPDYFISSLTCGSGDLPYNLTSTFEN